jgi:hypothetical protein
MTDSITVIIMAKYTISSFIQETMIGQEKIKLRNILIILKAKKMSGIAA